MEQKEYIIERDWECDGALRIKNATTIKHYQELRDGMSKFDVYANNIFFAFSDKQFEEGKKKAHITDDMKIYSYGAGMFGTHEGFKKYLAACEECDRRIKEECDPQEIYVYEYNNHECMIDWDGDENAIIIIIDTWGADVAKSIKRYSVQRSIDEIIKEREERAARRKAVREKKE